MRLQELLSRRRVVGAYLGLALIAALAVACTGDSVTGVDEVQVPDPAAEELRVWRCSGDVTVMTWNVYVGADLESVLGAAPEEIPLAVAQAFQTVVANDFPARAKAIARQIARFRPHLVGLQEVSTIYRQSPGDYLIGNQEEAGKVEFDYLEILMAALKARGLHYKVAGHVRNFNIEMPMWTGHDPTQYPFPYDDVRLEDWEVVLARSDVGVSGVVAENYAAMPPLELIGLKLPSGYVALNAQIGRKSYRFASTHLQALWFPGLVDVQRLQAQELVALLEHERLPVIVVGDLNSRAAGGEEYERQTYQFMLGAGYVDTWTRNINPYEGEGLTNAQGYFDLTDPTRVFDQRIDFIFARNDIPCLDEPAIGPVVATLVGDARRDRTYSGLWPSDHAGIVARLDFPRVRRFARRW